MTDETEKRPEPGPEPKQRRRSHRPPPITDEQRAEILRLATEVRWGARQIAKNLGLSRSQVRTVLEAARPATREPDPTTEKAEDGSASLLDPFRLTIADKVAKGITTTRILRELQEEGYEGGRTILMITHEADVARHARRVVLVRDGRVVKDEPIEQVRA